MLLERVFGPDAASGVVIDIVAVFAACYDAEDCCVLPTRSWKCTHYNECKTNNQ